MFWTKPAKLFVDGPPTSISERRWQFTAVVGRLLTKNNLIFAIWPPRKKKVGKSEPIFSPMTPQCCSYQGHGHIGLIQFDQGYIRLQFNRLSMQQLPFLVGQNERRSFLQGNKNIAPSTPTKHKSSPKSINCWTKPAKLFIDEPPMIISKRP